MIVTFLAPGELVPCDGCSKTGAPWKAAILRRAGCEHAYCDACRAERAVEPCRACTVADAARAAEKEALRKARRIAPLPVGVGSHGEKRKALPYTKIRCLACQYERPPFDGWALAATRCDRNPTSLVHMWAPAWAPAWKEGEL